MSLFCRWFWGLFMPNDVKDDHADAIELGQVVGAVQDDQQAGIRPPYIGNVLGAGQIMAAAIDLDGDGGGGVGDQHAVELQAAEVSDTQDENGIGDGGYSSGGDAGQHAAEQQAAEEGNIQDENGGGDGGNAGQGVADPQHGLPASIGNGSDRLRKLLFFLLVEVLRLVALFYIKTVILEDSLSLSNVLQPCVGIALIVASIVIECLRLGGVVNDTEANLIFIRSKRVMSFAQLLLSLLGVLC